MIRRALLGGLVAAVLVSARPADACCPAGKSGEPVLNADQSVILVWDAASKTQHFIRRAAFATDAKEDFGFLVPTPSQPELAESGDEAFPFLQKLTEPEHIKEKRPSASGGGCCAGDLMYAKSARSAPEPPPVTVLDEKTVAGFHAVVLEAQSSKALVGWLEEHHYAFSPQIEAWAKPYVDGGWKITALKIAKDKNAQDPQRVVAGSLRLSFKTERPLFPYREPDYGAVTPPPGTRSRLLRIYFLSDARYDGALEKDRLDERAPREVWNGHTAWAGKLKPEDRARTLKHLGLPETTGPAEWWLTELENYWPYRVMPADVYFSRSPDQSSRRRDPIIEYVMNDDDRRPDTGTLAVMVLALPPLAWQLRRRKERSAGPRDRA